MSRRRKHRMSTENIDCCHLVEILDERNGDIICSLCGLVLDRFYVGSITEDYDSCDTLEWIIDLLDKLQLPQVFSKDIFNKFQPHDEKGMPDKTRKSMLCYYAYLVLNDNKIPVSIKDISACSGISTDDIYKHQQSVVFLDFNELINKYCSILEIPYQDCNVIKSNFPELLSGHNPLTVIGANIYTYCKEKKIKKTLKEISDKIGISSVSIQRYLKQK